MQKVYKRLMRHVASRGVCAPFIVEVCLFILYLVKVLLCGSHLLPRLVEKLNADAEKLVQQSILTEEDGMVV